MLRVSQRLELSRNPERDLRERDRNTRWRIVHRIESLKKSTLHCTGLLEISVTYMLIREKPGCWSEFWRAWDPDSNIRYRYVSDLIEGGRETRWRDSFKHRNFLKHCFFCKNKNKFTLTFWLKPIRAASYYRWPKSRCWFLESFWRRERNSLTWPF